MRATTEAMDEELNHYLHGDPVSDAHTEEEVMEQIEKELHDSSGFDLRRAY